jgi:23S rRNA pseudouridine1911/1915/1917 synthase
VKNDVVLVKEPQRLLDLVIKARSYASNTRARDFIKDGRVLRNGTVCKIPSTELVPGDKIEFRTTREIKTAALKEQAPRFEIVWEEDNYVAVLKPAGLSSVEGGEKEKCMASLLRQYYRARGIDFAPVCLNRIEKKESGILLFALGPNEAAEGRNFMSEATRRYYAIVEAPVPKEDFVLKHNLAKNTIDLLKSYKSREDTIEAITRCRKMNENEEYVLIKAIAEPGIRNQVRAQLAAAGKPVVGDKRYGSRLNPGKQIFLHLFSIVFQHPRTGATIEIKTRVPRDFLKLTK